MSLRVRLLVVVAATFALVVVGSVYAAHVLASRQLRSATDQFLEQRADRFTHAPPGNFGGGGDFVRGPHGEPPLADPDAITQILAADGSIANSITGEPRLPVDAHDRLIAKQGGTSTFRNVTLDGTPYRMLTVARGGGGAAQIARNIKSDNDVLSALDTRLLLIALAGTVVAAGLAWLIARRLVRPIEQLTSTATYVADTQDLENRIEVKSHDEVGQLAASFNTMLDALHTSREQQKRLVVDASHELRTPLTALRTNIELLQRADTMSESERSQLLAETTIELRELTDLVAELVDLATDTRATEPVQPVDLAELADNVVNRYRRRTTRELTLETHAPSVVDGRVGMLERALSNLIDNALKFSPPDSVVTVVVEGSRIDVLDRGPGIDADDRSRVFDRFYRASDARTKPGSGLGLAIVKQIADLHHAAVTIDPRPGGGTASRIEFVAAPEPRSTSADQTR